MPPGFFVGYTSIKYAVSKLYCQQTVIRLWPYKTVLRKQVLIYKGIIQFLINFSRFLVKTGQTWVNIIGLGCNDKNQASVLFGTTGAGVILIYDYIEKNSKKDDDFHVEQDFESCPLATVGDRLVV